MVTDNSLKTVWFHCFFSYFTVHLNVVPKFWPDNRYPALRLAGYPAKSVFGASLISIIVPKFLVLIMSIFIAFKKKILLLFSKILYRTICLHDFLAMLKKLDSGQVS
jgi:hypothetical protein